MWKRFVSVLAVDIIVLRGFGTSSLETITA